jgi:hypothetical protein
MTPCTTISMSTPAPREIRSTSTRAMSSTARSPSPVSRSAPASASAVKPEAVRVALAVELAHAERLARTLDVLLARIDRAPDAVATSTPSDEEERAYVWLLGRSSEVRAFAAEIARMWMVGEIDEVRACAALEGYLESLHAALRPWYGEWYAPTCCGPCGEHADEHEHDTESRASESPSSGVRQAAAPVDLGETLADEPSPSRLGAPRVRRRFDSRADTASMTRAAAGLAIRPVRLPRDTRP